MPQAQIKAADASRQLAGRDARWAWKFRFLEANIRTQQGLGAEVISLMRDEPPASVASPDFTIQRDVFRAIAHVRLGDIEQAEREAHEALDLSVRAHSTLESDALYAVGFVDLQSNRLAEAASLFEASRQRAHASSDRYLETRSTINQAVVALRKEHYDEALDFLGSASDLARAMGAKLLLEKSLGNIGWAHHELGDRERALANFQQASAEAENLGAVLDEVGWLDNAGQELYLLGDLSAAEVSYRKALAIAEQIHNTRETVSVQMDLANLLFQRGQLSEADQYADRALASARSVENIPAELDLIFLKGELAAQKGNGKEAERLFREVHSHPSAWPFQKLQAEEAIANLFDNKSQAEQAESWYRKALSTFEQQRASIKEDESKLPFFANANQIYDDYVGFLIRHQRPDAALELLDLGRARTLEEGLGLHSGSGALSRKDAVNPKALAARLRAVILVYSLGPQESYLWGVTPSESRLFKLPKEADVAAMLKTYQKAIRDSDDVLANVNPAGLALYDALVGPAQSMISPHSRVFIIADGVLNTLNFETLLVAKPSPHYWIDDVVVTNASSLRLLEAFANHAHSNASRGLLLIGNPNPVGVYPALPNAAPEVTAIEDHFPAGQRMVLTRDRAFPGAYAASHPERFSYIHFVAHGTASHLTPLESAVVLSPAPGKPQAFKLYAREVVKCPLHAELVTISACYGSGSRNYAGEGMLGLSWAFLRAGAHNVVGALWEVSDSSAPELMDRLYAELEKGAPPDEALRTAKLALAHSQRTFRKPLYWAGFQLYAGS